MAYILLIPLVLGLIALVGHGLWLLAAALIRAAARALERKRALNRELADLEAMDRQLGRFLEQERVPADACQALRQQIAERQEFLSARRRENDLERGRRALRWKVQTPLFFLWLATFVLCVALGLLVTWNISQGAAAGAVLGGLAVLIACAGLPLLLGGLELRASAAARKPVLAKPGFAFDLLAPAGAWATILSGFFVLLAAIALAWHAPAAVLCVGAMNFTALTAIAFRRRFLLAHVVALPCLTAAYLSAFHLPRDVPLGEALFAPATGTGLMLLFVLVGGASEILVRKRHIVHALFYATACGVIALASLLLVTLPRRGLDDPATALGAYAFFGIGLLILNARWRQPLVSSIGLTLLVAASLWGLWRHCPHQVSIWGAILAGEALVLSVLAFLCDLGGHGTKSGESGHETKLSGFVREPLARTAAGVAPLALLTAFWSVVPSLAWGPEQQLTGIFVSAAYLFLALVERRLLPARLAGWTFAGTSAVAACWWVDAFDESSAPPLPALAALCAAAAGTALASVSAWAVFRRGVQETRAAHTRLDTLTAWRGTAAGVALLALAGTLVALFLGGSILPAYSFLLLAATCLLLAWQYDSALLTWAASFLVLGSITHALLYHPPALAVPMPWAIVALLCHASLGLAASFVLKAWPSLQRVYTRPLRRAALMSSFLALGVFLQIGWGRALSTSLCLFWLAFLWLVVAWLERRPRWFAAFQAVLVTVVGSVFWAVWGEPALESFAYVQVVCLALSAAGWSVLKELPPRSLRDTPCAKGSTKGAGGLLLPTAHLKQYVQMAATLALALLTAVVVAGVLLTLNELREPASMPWTAGPAGMLAWTALGATLLAFLLRLRDADWAARDLALQGLYAIGILGIGLALDSARLNPRDYCWWAGLLLAAYFLLAVLFVWTIPVRRLLGSRRRRTILSGQNEDWFLPTQIGVALVAVSAIFYAGVNQVQVWLLWTSGSALGIATLAFSGALGKRRTEMLRLLDKWKRWK